MGSDRTLRVWPNPIRRAAQISLRIPGARGAKVSILDAGGRVLRSFPCKGRGPGERTITWDGLDDAGRPLNAGVYFLKVQAESGRMGAKLLLIR